MFQTFQTCISDETYERLRQVLEKQNGHSYTLEEVKEVGDGLIDFYALLLEFGNEVDREMRMPGMHNS